MMEMEVTGEPGAINFGASGAEEIAQNIRMILTNPVYSCPLYREFSYSPDLDAPIQVAQARLSSRLSEAIRKYESRVQFLSVTFRADAFSGKLIPTVRVRILEGGETR